MGKPGGSTYTLSWSEEACKRRVKKWKERRQESVGKVMRNRG